MSIGVSSVIAVVAAGGLGFWLFRRRRAFARQRDEEHRAFGRRDHTRALELAQIESEVARWRGQW